MDRNKDNFNQREHDLDQAQGTRVWCQNSEKVYSLPRTFNMSQGFILALSTYERHFINLNS